MAEWVEWVCLDKKGKMAERSEDLNRRDSTLNVENVIAVMESVPLDRRKEVWSDWSLVPDKRLDEIYQKYSTEEQRLHACADVYVSVNPESSWTDLCQGLYYKSEMTAARKAKTFIPQTDPSMTVENVIKVVEKVTDGRHMKVWKWCLYEDTLEEINRKCFTEKELTHTCSDLYVHCNPDSSWEGLALGLYHSEETAAVEEVRSYLPPKDLTLTSERVVELFSSLKDDDVDDVGSYLYTPPSKQEEFKMNYQSPARRKETYLDYYIHNHPTASWTTIAEALRDFGLPQQADVVENTYIQAMDSSKDAQKTWLTTNYEETPTSGPAAKKVKFSDLKNEFETQFAFTNFSSYAVNHLVRDTFPNTVSKRSGKSKHQYFFGLAKKVPINAHDTPSMTSLSPSPSTSCQQSETVDLLLKCSHMEEQVQELEKECHGSMVRQADCIVLHKCSMTQGPDTIDHFHEFSIDSIISDLREQSPDLYALFLKIGDTRRNTDGADDLSAEDVKVVASLCTLLNARSNRVKGLQLMITLMLIARAISRQAISTLSHFGFCMSYTSMWSYLMRLVTEAQYLEKVKMGKWIWVYDNLNYYRWVRHERKVSERTRLEFEEAMTEGKLWIRNGNTFFMGAGGSGKSHAMAILLEEDPPVRRESTGCTTRPVRTVAQFKIGVNESARFIRITDQHYSEMIANSAKQFSAVPKAGASVNPLKRAAVANQPLSFSVKALEPLSVSPAVTNISTAESDVHSQPPVSKSGLKKDLLCLMQSKPAMTEKLNNKDLFNNRDSGGQPMFHEVLPVFITNTVFGLLTVKLNESLDSYPLVEYYIGGRRIGEPFKSPFTHLQIIRHSMKALQSTSERGTRPKLVFLGTHKDLEDDCKHEDRKEKNRKILAIIPPEMKDSVIFNGESLEELIFGINAKVPGDEDRDTMARIRTLMIKELRKLPRKEIPLRHFSLEMAFQRLAKVLRKTILSIEEAFAEAKKYHFTRESFEHALLYLHNLKLIIYYKDILPGIVFIDAQVLLDKITELVEYSIRIRAKPSSQDLAFGNLEKFRSCGIVTTDILSQFRSGYVPELFTEEELLLLFERLLILADLGGGKYLMPCLLEEEKVSLSLGSYSQVVPALLYYFGEDGPKLGVYCALLASVITEAKWDLLTEGGSPVQVSRNRARFALPGNNPGCITITDSFSTFLHVGIEFPEKVTDFEALEICKEVCPTVRETILANIRKASRKLNYNNSIPEAAFLCSEHGDTSLHPATISRTGFLTCTTHPRSVFSKMTDKHRVWLGEAKASSSESTVKVTLPSELSIKDLRKVQKALWGVRTKWYNIGLELDVDPETLDAIELEKNKKVDDCLTAMLKTWLRMDQPKPTSAALATALNSPTVGCGYLAEQFR